MGYLLKEALKTLCGVDQWSYAVFWKIGAQNPTLLIWEECYHAHVSCSSVPCITGIESSGLGFEEWEACYVSGEPQSAPQTVLPEDKITSLINNMFLANRVKIVGQGLVGRSVFTGNHMWILSDNYNKEIHPPEVQNELCEQFNAHIKTIAVIPVFTHGVVQFGSSSAIMESMTFVSDVKNLILQVGCMPGAPFSDNYMLREHVPQFGVPLFQNEAISAHPSENYKRKQSVQQQNVLLQTSAINQLSNCSTMQLETSLQGTSSNLQTETMAQNVYKSADDFSLVNTIIPMNKQNLHLSSQIDSRRLGVEVIPSNSELRLHPQASLPTQRSGFDGQPYVGPSSANYSNLGNVEGDMMSDAVLHQQLSGGMSLSESISSQLRTSGSLSSTSVPLHGGVSDDLMRSIPKPTVDILCSNPVVTGPSVSLLISKTPESNSSSHVTSTSSILRSSNHGHHSDNGKWTQVEVAQIKGEPKNDRIEDVFGFENFITKNVFGARSPGLGPSGDDLFDILGADFKHKLFGDSWNDFVKSDPNPRTESHQKDNFMTQHFHDSASDIYSGKGSKTDSIFSCSTGTDHLLDAVVSKIHSASKQKLDNGVSCTTTMTNVSSSSVANVSPSCGQVKGPALLQGKISGLPLSLAKLAGVGAVSFKSEKEDTGNYSETSSLYGSQVSSWVEQGPPSVKQNSGSSKRLDEVGKSNRKRLKPGESPRPRPKDRQMIQDRMKELREIVPNGAKLSIDALLERTIKHMLFLQSVTKHADKLKQTGESKIINKDGGLVLRDSFEGGRTWACEVGSQNMVCPIIVEDLNPPRQMLVEMLCEERGLFLEIADIIRGLGLTILKGVMETRSNKIWARFAVEADRDVTRMEIFLSLVHLLEQTVNSIPSSCNGIDSNAISLHQAASISATGRPCSLQ